jgi:hypothetical protein
MAAKPKVTPAQITEWLKQNPTKKRGSRTFKTTVADAKQALGYEGPALKIREGNLSSNRGNLRISEKGRSSQSDYFRRQAQIATTPDPAERQKANIKTKYINKRGKVADHRLTNSALKRGEEFVRELRGETGVEEMRSSYRSVGGYGHTKENIQALTPEANTAKEVQERKLRGNSNTKNAYLSHLAAKPQNPSSPEFAKWEIKRQQYATAIEANYMPTKPTQLKNNAGTIRFNRSLIPAEVPSQERYGPGGMIGTIDLPHERQFNWQR